MSRRRNPFLDVRDKLRQFLGAVLLHLVVSTIILAEFYVFELVLHVLPRIYYPWIGVMIKIIQAACTIVALLILVVFFVQDILSIRKKRRKRR